MDSRRTLLLLGRHTVYLLLLLWDVLLDLLPWVLLVLLRCALRWVPSLLLLLLLRLLLRRRIRKPGMLLRWRTRSERYAHLDVRVRVHLMRVQFLPLLPPRHPTRRQEPHPSMPQLLFRSSPERRAALRR